MPKLDLKKQAQSRTGTQGNTLEIREIPIGDIELKDNIRAKNDISINELAESIKSVGLLQPITVYKKGDGYVCIMGHRRLLAYRKLYQSNPDKFHSIKAIITDKKDLTAKQVIENIQREQLSQFELYEIIKKFKKQGLKLKAIAELLGKAEQTIKNWSVAIKEIDQNPKLKNAIKYRGSTLTDIADTKGIKDTKERVDLINAKAEGKVSQGDLRKKTVKKTTTKKDFFGLPLPVTFTDKKELLISVKCKDIKQFRAIERAIETVIDDITNN